MELRFKPHVVQFSIILPSENVSESLGGGEPIKVLKIK